ncbi:MAG: hypothetical protein H6718_17140 [Polyangiaceae bacterium]|nr:hypothetical protein [Myxococcales bacterium]MCB9587127.1 hypothetical protein [Polyangiaceae bacterium]MCB9609498.1 hypothetical protein [Polyangiaceae bacterium]
MPTSALQRLGAAFVVTVCTALGLNRSANAWVCSLSSRCVEAHVEWTTGPRYVANDLRPDMPTFDIASPDDCYRRVERLFGPNQLDTDYTYYVWFVNPGPEVNAWHCRPIADDPLQTWLVLLF